VIGDLQLAAVLTLACLVALRGLGRLDFLQAELGPGRRRWLGLGLVFVVLAMAVFFPVATYGDARLFDPLNVHFATLFAGHALLVLFLLAWWWLSGRPPWREYLSLPRQRLAGVVGSGIFAGSVGWAITLLVAAGVASSVGSVTEVPLAPPEAPPIMLWMAGLPLWRKLVIVVVAMTVEEGFFRAFLQPRVGLWLSTTLFALAHFNYGLPLMVVAVFTISLVFGTLFQVRRNLLSCIIAHGIFDSIQIFLIIPLAVRHLS
jgi:membrane protease YdiL (CAAX protease family)